jgi:hypothetical protein
MDQRNRTEATKQLKENHGRLLNITPVVIYEVLLLSYRFSNWHINIDDP